MTFTDINAITLVAWFTSVAVFYYLSASVMMRSKFRKWYDEVRHLRYADGHRVMHWLPPAWVYGVVWTIIYGCVVASLTLWTMNFYTCYNTYFIVIIALVLAHFVFISSFTPALIWHDRPFVATILMALVIASGVLVLTFMAITTTFNTDPTTAACLASNSSNPSLCGGTNCITDKTAGYVAIALWALPHVWYIFVLFVTMKFMWLDPAYTFRKWMKIQYPPKQQYAFEGKTPTRQTRPRLQNEVNLNEPLVPTGNSQKKSKIQWNE